MEMQNKVESFSAKAVGEHVVHLIKTAENGSIWISDDGLLEQISMTEYHLPSGW